MSRRTIEDLGYVNCSAAALLAISAYNQTRDQFLERHLARDFGEETYPENGDDLEEHMADRRPIVSYFKVGNSETLWIVTEAGWHVTRVCGVRT
jgi:hypothetical protein